MCNYLPLFHMYKLINITIFFLQINQMKICNCLAIGRVSNQYTVEELKRIIRLNKRNKKEKKNYTFSFNSQKLVYLFHCSPLKYNTQYQKTNYTTQNWHQLKTNSYQQIAALPNDKIDQFVTIIQVDIVEQITFCQFHGTSSQLQQLPCSSQCTESSNCLQTSNIEIIHI